MYETIYVRTDIFGKRRAAYLTRRAAADTAPAVAVVSASFTFCCSFTWRVRAAERPLRWTDVSGDNNWAVGRLSGPQSEAYSCSMRNTISILASLLLAASSLCAQAGPTQSPPSSATVNEPQLLGTWVAVHRSLGGLGSMWTFLPGGKLEMSVGAIVEGWYMVEGDKLIEPPGSTLPNAKPEVSRFRVEGDTLIKQYEKHELRLLRVGKEEHEAAPIVGVWRSSKATTDIIMKEQRRAGHDQRTAQRTADMFSLAWTEYTRDGLIKFRLRMRTTRGTYDVATQTYILAPENTAGSRSAKRGGRFRLENGLLVLTQSDGKTEDTYIHAEATKEQLKRAGVRYGSKPAELDPPS